MAKNTKKADNQSDEDIADLIDTNAMNVDEPLNPELDQILQDEITQEQTPPVTAADAHAENFKKAVEELGEQRAVIALQATIAEFVPLRWIDGIYAEETCEMLDRAVEKVGMANIQTTFLMKVDKIRARLKAAGK